MVMVKEKQTRVISKVTVRLSYGAFSKEVCCFFIE